MLKTNVSRLIGIAFLSAANCSAAAIGFTVCCAGGPLTYTQIFVPGSTNTYAFGVNDSGHVVGDYNFGVGGDHGFLDVGGTYTTIDYPGAESTSLYGINSSGQIAGSFTPAGGSNPIGFLYSGGIFTSIQYPGATSTQPSGITASGQIVGTYGGSGITNGFIYSGGSFISISPPGSIFSEARGINNGGIVVGDYNTCNTSNCTFGYVYTPGVGYTSFDTPSGKILRATGVNDLGQIVGDYVDPGGSGEHGFVDIGGTFTPLDYPGSILGITSTDTYGINNNGEVVGYAFSFVGVPEPPSTVLIFLAAITLIVARNRTTRKV